MTTGDGSISFDEYIAFMADEHADAETSAQLFDAFKVIAGDKVRMRIPTAPKHTHGIHAAIRA